MEVRKLVLLVVPVLAMAAPPVAAQEQAAAESGSGASDPRQIETVVVVGTRSAPRSVRDAPVPIDVIDGEVFARQSGSDISNLIRSVVPSFHVNANPSRDLAALQRPINLRGLAPDHTLVLMNNKRRHRGSVIQWISNGASDGSQGPDISAIPGIAIEQMEVLRDGAAAQYGSDAIAGVINFRLKDNREGVSLEAKYGVYDEDSDEDLFSVAANFGLPLTDRGFANFSIEYGESSPTDRSVQHGHATQLIDVGIPNVAVPAKPWGEADVEDSLKLVLNTGLDIADNHKLYLFGNYANRDVTTAFFYRSPMNRNGVYKTSDNDFLIGGEGCAAKYGDVPATAANVPVYRNRLRADAGCFAFIETLPEGFTPDFGAEMTDSSLVAGMKGVLRWGLFYDVSASFGQNNMEAFIHNTLNASFGPDSPRSFDIGEYTQTEIGFNADFSYPADVGLASDLNIAGGFEWRDEEFEISTGEEASWQTGPYGRYGFAARSNGFGGFNPASSGEWSRDNLAAYVDLEVDVTSAWRVGGALRWEDFDDFGTTTNFKLATRVQVFEEIALRSSYGTGFRAPTPGQSNARNLSTVVNAETNEFEERGTIGSTHPVAQALGARELGEEESENFTFGAVLDLDNGLSLTVDWFRIDVEDRISLSGLTAVTDEIKQDLIAAGVPGAAEFTSVRWFTNDFDTETQGIDVVLTYGVESSWGATDFLFSFNRTKTDVERWRAGSTITGGDTIENLEKGAPETRYGFTATHSLDSWHFLARYNYFGDWYDDHSADEFDGYGMVDLSVQYLFDTGLALTLAAENVFDKYPDKAVNSGNGRKYPRYSPGGHNGRLLYTRLSYEF